MYGIRIFFEKVGVARYISHLDLMRNFERAMRRADIPFWYTEGFNPRPFLTFALPLSLGVAGKCEVVDIRLVEDMTFEEVRSRLNAALPDGIKVLRIAEPVKKPKEIAASEYTITMTDIGDAQSVCEKLEAFLQQESIVTVKLNKRKKPVETEIKRFIHGFSVEQMNDAVVLKVTLASGCTDNCNPALVLDAFKEQCGVDNMYCDIVRERVLDGEMHEFE